jgi:hypothetical protein
MSTLPARSAPRFGAGIAAGAAVAGYAMYEGKSVSQ